MSSKGLSSGDFCLLAVRDVRFYCQVISNEDESIQIRFNIANALVEGMLATLERYDEEGVEHFPVRVEHSPVFPEDPAQLKIYAQPHRHVNRGGWRIPSEFALRLKRKRDANYTPVVVNDISAGGAQVETTMDLSPVEQVEISVLIPGETAEDIINAEITYIAPEPIDIFGAKAVGLHFIGSQDFEKKLTAYIWRRIRKLHPEEFNS